MARKAKNPDQELAALFEKRVGLAAKRHELENAEKLHATVVGEFPDREHATRRAMVRREAPSPSLEELKLELQGAKAAIEDCKKDRDALRDEEQGVEAEVDAVLDAHPEHFLQAAIAASEATSEAITAALDATQAAATAWMGTREAWGRVRLSRRRRGLELGPEVPVSDLGQSVNELSKAQPRPWPGGRREAYERFREHEARARVSRSSANSRTDREPSIELIG